MYTLTVQPKPTYLHITVTGQNSRATVAGYIEEIFPICVAHNCFRILIEENLIGQRLRIFDIFEIVSEGSRQTLGKMEAIAFVDINAEGSLMQFAETVAVNRALPMTVFATVSDAEKWLVAQS